MTDILLECTVGTAVEVQITPLDSDGAQLVGGVVGTAAVAPESGIKQAVAIAVDGSLTFVPDEPGLWSVGIRITAPVQASGDAYVRVNPLILEP